MKRSDSSMTLQTTVSDEVCDADSTVANHAPWVSAMLLGKTGLLALAFAAMPITLDIASGKIFSQSVAQAQTPDCPAGASDCVSDNSDDSDDDDGNDDHGDDDGDHGDDDGDHEGGGHDGGDHDGGDHDGGGHDGGDHDGGGHDGGHDD
jgi:hypothetical protein